MDFSEITWVFNGQMSPNFHIMYMQKYNVKINVLTFSNVNCFRTTMFFFSRLAIKEVSRKRSRMFVKLTKIQYSSRHISPFSTSARNRAKSQTRTVGTGSTAMQPFISTRRRADTSPST